MKLAFSESQPDYGHYIFPYAIWAFPEPGETPADFFDRGFLPSSRDLDRFYLCRQVRVNLRQYRTSSENRRILTEVLSDSYVLLADAGRLAPITHELRVARAAGPVTCQFTNGPGLAGPYRRQPSKDSRRAAFFLTGRASLKKSSPSRRRRW